MYKYIYRRNNTYNFLSNNIYNFFGFLFIKFKKKTLEVFLYFGVCYIEPHEKISELYLLGIIFVQGIRKPKKIVT